MRKLLRSLPIALTILIGSLILITSSVLVVYSASLKTTVDAEEIGDTDPNEFEKSTSTVKVRIGSNSSNIISNSFDLPQSHFTPRIVEIQRGDSVVWFSDTPEPNTVTFVKNNTLQVSPIELFSDSNSSLAPLNTGMPVQISYNGTEFLIAFNAYAFQPVIVDVNGTIAILDRNDASYEMRGNEQFVNSGILVKPLTEYSFAVNSNNNNNNSMNKIEGGIPSLNNFIDVIDNLSKPAFRIIFHEPGEYEYKSLFDPGMNGTIIVK